MQMQPHTSNLLCRRRLLCSERLRLSSRLATLCCVGVLRTITITDSTPNNTQAAFSGLISPHSERIGQRLRYIDEAVTCMWHAPAAGTDTRHEDRPSAPDQESIRIYSHTSLYSVTHPILQHDRPGPRKGSPRELQATSKKTSPSSHLALSSIQANKVSDVPLSLYRCCTCAAGVSPPRPETKSVLLATSSCS